MRSFVAFSNLREPRKAAENLNAAADECGFEPNLALFYATQKYAGHYDEMLGLLHRRLGDVPCIGGSVDGMLFPHDLRTDGAMLVLCDKRNAKVRVASAHGGSTSENVSKVAAEVSCKQGVVVLHFPLFHVPPTATSVAMVARGRYYSRRCRTAKTPDEARQFAVRFSEYLDRINFAYPIQDIVISVAKACAGKVPVIGAGLLHSSMKFNTPNIFANFNDIGGGVAALVVEHPSSTACYDDVFPSRGDSVEASIEAVKGDITFVKKYEATTGRNILMSMDGRPTGEEFADILRQPTVEGDEMQIEDLGKGTYSVYKPHGIAFTNPRTQSLLFVGAGNYYPFGLFPTFANLDDFSPTVHLVRETILGRHMDYISTVRQVPGSGFNVFFIDSGAIPAYGMHIYEYLKDVELHLKDNYAGIMAAPPAAYLPPGYQRRPHLTEITKGLFFSSTGANVCLEF